MVPNYRIIRMNKFHIMNGTLEPVIWGRYRNKNTPYHLDISFINDNDKAFDPYFILFLGSLFYRKVDREFDAELKSAISLMI